MAAGGLGLGYVNSLIEQDTATAIDSGGVLPTSHFLQYSLDTSFNGTGTLVGGSGSYDSVAIQDNGDIVVGRSLRLQPGHRPLQRQRLGRHHFGTSGRRRHRRSSPSFAKLALDSSGNIDVAVNSGKQRRGLPAQQHRLDQLEHHPHLRHRVVPQGIALEPSGGDIIVAGDSSSGTGIYLAALNPAPARWTPPSAPAAMSTPRSAARPAAWRSPSIPPARSWSPAGLGDFSVVRFSSGGAVDTQLRHLRRSQGDMAERTRPTPSPRTRRHDCRRRRRRHQRQPTTTRSSA